MCKSWLKKFICPSCHLVIPAPEISIKTEISRQDYLNVLGLPAYNPDRPLDGILTITSKSNLGLIAPWLVYPADNYISEISDCEDYAIQAQSDAAFKFGISGIRMALGNTPLGYHGFAMTFDTDSNIWLLEPNAGFDFAGVWFKTGEHGYMPEVVFA